MNITDVKKYAKYYEENGVLGARKTLYHIDRTIKELKKILMMVRI